MLPVLVFMTLYVTAALVAALVTRNHEFLFYIVVMLVLSAVVVVVHRRVNFGTGTLWALSAWGAAHMAGGIVPVPAEHAEAGAKPVLYSLWLIGETVKYDQVVHAYGFGLCTWVCWVGLKKATGVTEPTLGRVSLAALAAFGLGAVNELIEFVATRLVAETNVGGYVNTGWDLVSNGIGVLAVAIWIGVTQRRRA